MRVAADAAGCWRPVREGIVVDLNGKLGPGLRFSTAHEWSLSNVHMRSMQGLVLLNCADSGGKLLLFFHGLQQ